MKPDNSVDGIMTKDPARPEQQTTKPQEPISEVPDVDTIVPTDSLESPSIDAVVTKTPAPADTEKGDGGSKAIWIMITILALLIGSGIGYIIGSNTATSQSQQELENQIQSLESDLESAQKAVSTELDDNQETIDEGQETVESLEAANAELQSTVDAQAEQIADLEQQIEDLENPATPTN